MQSDFVMKVPKDQNLFLTIFFILSFTVILLFWLILPSQRHFGEEEEDGVVKVEKPEVVIENTAVVLDRAEEVLTGLEKEHEGKSKGKDREDQKKGTKK
jgi:hypothetical protein